MTLAGFLHVVNAAGIRLVNTDGNLQMRSSPGAITDEIKASAVEHKAALLAILPPFLAAPLQQLQTHKTELLAMPDTDIALAELRRFVGALWKDHAWRSEWEYRFKAARYADFASLRRVLDIIIDLAEGHHRRHDWKAFDSARKYLHRLASGEEWDRVAPIQDDDRWEIKT